MNKDKKYVVHCGDAHFRFSFGRLCRMSYLNKVFEQKLEVLQERYGEDAATIRAEFFPGLLLRDGEGRVWKPVVNLKSVGGLDEETSVGLFVVELLEAPPDDVPCPLVS